MNLKITVKSSHWKLLGWTYVVHTNFHHTLWIAGRILVVFLLPSNFQEVPMIESFSNFEPNAVRGRFTKIRRKHIYTHIHAHFLSQLRN